MKTSKLFQGLFLALMLFLAGNAQAGDTERKRQAIRLFTNKQYAQAMPMFAQLVANHPDNYKYNYYYGVCLLLVNKDKDRAVQYLETSLKSPKCPEEVYYYLARAYHMSYLFDEGIRAISEFNKIVKPKTREKFKTSEVAEQIYCAKRTLDTTKVHNIAEMNPASQSDFFSKYEFQGNYGKILSMPEEYMSKKDEDNPTIFLSANGNVMYYAAYSAETGSKDIFRVTKSTDGSWNKPERLDATVNTNRDEMYPTCSADGSVLYFSSKGHNSTGGFDIYKTVFSRTENKWTEAANMGSPYNSPFDDFNYLPSAEDKFAYFSSTRNSDFGQVMVCKNPYSASELPIELKGSFACINTPDMKSAKITITRSDNDSMIAELNTDPKTGTYNVMLPGAGKYNFKVECEGYQPHSQTATFTEFGEAFFIQQIYMSRDQSGAEDVAINNLTETEFNRIASSLVAMEDENGVSTTTADLAASVMNNGTMNNTTAMSTTDETMAAAKEAEMNMAGIEFRVQIAALKHQTKEEAKRVISRKTKNPMMSDSHDENWLRFYVGHEPSYEKARELKTILLQAGFKDAFIVAFRDNQPIPTQKARTLKK